LRILFVTGTDTGIGKTWVTAALARAYAAQGLRVAALKPYVSGCQEDGTFADVEALCSASSPPLRPAQCNLYAFAPPIAPHWAAQAAGMAMDRERLTAFVREQSKDRDIVLVEGAGGALVPLGPHWDTLDWVKDLGGQVLLVVGLRLGAINHARLTEEAILARSLAYAGWVGNQCQPQAPAQGTLESLQQWLKGPCLGILDWGCSHFTGSLP